MSDWLAFAADHAEEAAGLRIVFRVREPKTTAHMGGVQSRAKGLKRQYMAVC